jgi:hypothetical protein
MQHVSKQRIGKHASTIGVLLETVFPIRSLQNVYKEEFSWESAVEFRSSKWAVSRELRSAREAEKMALWVQVWSVNYRVRLWEEDLSSGSWRISLGRSRCQETTSGDCNRLRILVCVCQWSVKCSPEWCIQVVNKSIHQSIPRLLSHSKYLTITIIMTIIQLNSHLFTCKLSSPETSYKVCMSKKKKKKKQNT